MKHETGTDVIRAALTAHSATSLNMATLAQDLKISAETLRQFADGSRLLSPDVMAGLVKVLFHGAAEWDAPTDTLKAAYRDPPSPLGTAPPHAEGKPVGHTGVPPLYPPTGNKKPAW